MSWRKGLLRIWIVLAGVWMLATTTMMWSELRPIWNRPTIWPAPPSTFSGLLWMQQWGGWSESKMAAHFVSIIAMDDHFNIEGLRAVRDEDIETADYMLRKGGYILNVKQLYNSLLSINVIKVAPVMILPPLVVLAFGYSVSWAIRGFQERPRSVSTRTAWHPQPAPIPSDAAGPS